MKRLTRNTGMQNAGAQGAPAPATFDEYTAGSAAGTLPQTFDEYMAGRRQETQLPLTFDEYLAQAPLRQAQARQEERRKCMEASGFGQMQTDMQGLFERMDSYFRTQHRAGSGSAAYTQELGGMLKAVEQERDYFTRYADVLDEQETMSLQNELNGWESRIKTYQEAMSGGGSDTGTLAMASGMLRLQEQAQALFSETQQEQKPGTVVPAEWTKRAQSLQKDAEEVEAFLQKNNSAAAKELLQQAQAYKNQLANLKSLGTGRTNPLTGKQMPLMPQAAAVYTDTDMDGKADSLTQGGLYGQKLAQEQALTLSEQAEEKAKKADWANQTAKQHEEYIRKDFETLTNYAWDRHSKAAAENMDAQIIGQIAGRLYTLAHSGSCTEAEFEALVDNVENLKSEYKKELDIVYHFDNNLLDGPQAVIENALKSIPDKADLMNEFRYQKTNLTRENLPYKPVDELLHRLTYDWGTWGATEAEKQADEYFGKTVLPEYLANAEMTQEQYDRYLKEIEGLPQEAALRAAREANGLNGNREGQQAALESYKEIDAGTFGTMIQTGSENATENVMSKFPAGAEQVLVRGLGWIGRGVGRFLNMFGKNPVGDYFYEGGVKNSQYENEDWQEGKYREYKSGRATSDLLENGGKFEKWAAQTTMSLTQAAMEMAAAGAVAGQISAGSAALSQLSQGGKYASSLANTMKPASGYAKTVSQFAGLMKKSSNLLISANAALGKYGEVEDNGGSMPERALALIAGGLIEYETNGLFGGNPIVDPEGAGAVAKYVYKMTENETIRKIISSKMFDRIGEGLEEVASAVAGAALDYAMTGETELSAQELVDEFTVGVLLSMVMSAPDDVIDLTARTKSYVKANVITKFDRQAQGSLEALYAQMQKYSAEYLCGDEELMRMNGWDEETIRKKAAEWETIVQQFNTVADRLEKKGVEEQPFERYQRPENFTESAEVDTEYLEDLMANEAAAAEDLTDRALKIRILSMRAFIDSVRDSTKAEDVIQAESAQLRLDILEQERRNRAAQEQTQSAEQEEPVEAVQEEPAEMKMTEGGIINEQTQNYGTGAEWNAGMDSGGQTGGVGESKKRAYDGEKEKSRGGNISDAERKQKIDERIRRFSAIAQDRPMSELMEDGDPDVLVGVVPVRSYTEAMQRAQRELKQAGFRVTYVKGTMSVRGADGEYRSANGAYDTETKRIFASVSSAEFEPEQIAVHELYHGLVERKEADVDETLKILRENFSDEELHEIAALYEEMYFGAYENSKDVWEEVLADAYAGMNRFGDGRVPAMQAIVRKAAAEQGEQSRQTAQATRRTQESDGNKKTAREGGKMSFAGKKAKTASAKNLALAEAMEEDGASREEIWRKTGWIRGADKNWRFEIDDSKAEFRPEGDAGLMQEEGYRRLQELTDKWAESFDGGEDLTDAEEGEMEALEEKYSDRVWEKKYELQDFLKHDKLYEAYPLLRHTTLRFEKLDPGVKGKFDKRNGAIILSDSLFGKGPETLLHEIQHIIQKYEGFQGGTSPEYWARRDYESGDRLQERLQQEYDDILNGLTKEEQNGYIRYQEIDGELERLFYSEKPGDTEKYDRMDAEHDRLYEKLYPNEWFGKLLDLKRQMENPGEVYLGQYINSAGEIEARETASRRKMTAEERKNKMPDLGWDRAVFAEDAGNAMDAVLDGRLTADSTEQERYELLKNETLTLARPDESKLDDIDLADFNTRKKSAVMPGMKALAKKLGIMNVDLQNSRIEIPFQFSNRGLTTSLHHQLEYGGSYQDYARMMTCFNELIRNAVPIEIHREKKAGTSKENQRLKQVYVLISAFADESGISPVQLEVKEYHDAQNKLYLAVAMSKKESEVVEDRPTTKSGGTHPLFSDSKVSIADIFKNVNSKDGRFLKYVPDGFLSETQKEAKKDAIRKQNKEYEQYGRRDNITELHNLTEADLEAMYESPGIPVKSMLEDEDGAGDVSLVLRAKDADSDSANLLDMVAVVPDSADGWLLDKLKMNGLRVVEYESGNEAARQAALEDAREMAEKRLDEPKRGAKLSADRGEALRRKEEKLKAQQQKLEEEKKGVQEKYRKELTGGMRKLFNIQSYDKENLDNALEKTVLLTQQGVKLLQSERDALFETLMEMGTEVMPAEDYFSEIRAELRGRKIYVPQYVREEFGDDWNSFRKRAFGRSKIYFTDNVRDRGADVLMMEMAENYPGTFTEEYDTAEMLRQIVDAAEKGQDQRVSMQEAIQENQNRFGLKEEEQLAYLREKFDEALNEYTEKAGRDARKAMEAEEEKRVQENLDSIVEEYDSRGTQKEKTGFREPWSITEQAAQERGFPFLKGRQVYPLTTWVRAEDMGNYGLVLDHGTRKGTLTVLFRNKESGKNAILEMKAEELTPVDGVYQPGAEETAALLASMPQAKLEDETDAEDLKEFYRWQDEQRGNALEKRIAAEREQAEEERKDSLVREEEERRKQEKLEGVRKATEAFLKEGKKTALPYGKGKPLRSTSTTLTPPEAVELLQAATGKVWEIRNLKNGTWKATQSNKNAPQSEITQEEAVKRIKAASRKALEATAQTVLTDGVAKEDFKGSDAMEKAGIKIDGSITEYGLTDALRKNGSARNGIAWQIQSEIRRLGATEKEVALAQAIAYGRKSFRDLTEKEHYRIVATLANLYMSERMQGEDLILQRKLAISRQNFFKAMEMLPSAQEIQENPELFHPEKLLVMNYRTAQRSMLSIFGPERGAEINAYYFDPVIRNTAENYRWQNEQFDKVRRFEGKDGKKSELTEAESSYVHMLLDLEGYVKQAESNARKNDILEAAKKVAEGKDTEETAQDYGFTKEQTDLMEKYALWLNGVKNAKGIDKVKAENAAKVYRKLFDEYFEAVNDFLVSHGMQPIGRIEGYTPHIPLEEKFTLVGKALDKLGISEWLDRGQKTGTLPAEIAGQTEFFRPQKRWNPFFLSRKGDKTEYDIRKAFQSYVTYLGDVLYHTDDIQKLRGLESYLRAGTSGAVDAELEEAYQVASRRTLEEQIEWLQTKGRLDPERENFSEEEVAKALDKLIGDMIGEEKNKTRYSDFVVWLKNYTDILAGKQYGGDRGTEYHGGREFMNVGRRLVDTFARAKVAGNLTTVLNQSAQLSMLLSTRSKRAIMKASTDFISGKLGEFSKEIDFLTGKRGVSYLVQGTGAKVMEAVFKPAELADRMLSTIAARAAYYDAIQNGMEHEEAIRYADRYGRSLMADRTKGAMPNAFQSKGFVKRMLNIFQIEALNSWEFVSQDLPAEIKQTAQTFGKKKAAMQLARTIVAYLLSAFFLNRLTDELYGGTPQPFDLLGLTANFFASGKGLSTNDYMRSLINRGVEKLGGEKLFDVPEEREEFDGGEAVRDTGYNLMNEIPFASNLSGLMGWGDRSLPMPNIADGLINLQKAISQDGAISQNAGEKLLELLLEIAPGGNQAKKTAYGIKAAIQGGKTKGYGENERLQYPLKDGWSKAKAILFGVNATEESDRFYAGDGYGLTAKQTQLWKEMKEEGVDGYVLYGLMMRMEDAAMAIEVPKEKENETEAEERARLQAKEERRSAARAELVAQEGLTDAQKARVYGEMVSHYNDEQIDKLLDAGMKWKDISELLDKRGELSAGRSAGQWAAEFANWLNGKHYSAKQRDAIDEALLPEAADFYNAMSAAGVRGDTALKVEKKARELAGENDLTQKYKAQAVIQSNLSDKEAYAALGAIYSGSTAEGFREAQKEGIPAKVYAKFWTEAKELHEDKDEEGESIRGSRKEKVIELIDSLNLTAEQKDWLVQQEYKSVNLWEMPWR